MEQKRVVLQLVFTQMVDVERLASGSQDLLLLLSLSLLLSTSLLVSLFRSDTKCSDAGSKWTQTGPNQYGLG